MNIKSYLNLYELLEQPIASREENRAFGLAHVLLKNKPIEQLLVWSEEHSAKLKKPYLADTFSSYLYGVTLSLILIAFILGVISGVTLLSYSGHEPVNVIYFMAMVIALPLFTMTLTLLSMLRVHSSKSVLVHLSPAFWMEKILGLLPNKIEENIKTLKINPMLANGLVIKRSQLIALVFSLGLLLALIAVVVTKDIAFAWSTTLHIDAKTFHGFLYNIALPWREIVPSAVPSLELIEQSQYFRLGDKLSEDMISNASVLGEWWKFLAAATLFYAIILRFCMWLIASFVLKLAVKKSFFSLNGVTQLFQEMNEPIISTHAKRAEKSFIANTDGYIQTIETLDTSYDAMQGWAISHDELLVLGDSLHVISPTHFEVGGANSFEEDNEVISKSHGEILLVVKAWEPPTMDFVDYLTDLSSKVDKIIVMPVGTSDNLYQTTQNALDVWANKLALVNHEKVWLKL